MQNKVRFKIGEIEFEAEGDAEVIARERNEFVSTLLPLALDSITRTESARHIGRITALPQSSTVYETDSSLTVEDFRRMSLASYIKDKGAESNNDFILCAAFFKNKKDEMVSFSTTTAKIFFSEAKRPEPKNISAFFNQLAKRGLIMESPDAKGKNPVEYVLTSEGEEYIDKLSPKHIKMKRPSSKSRKKQKKPK